MPALCQPFQHDIDHRQLDEADGSHGESFVVGHQPPIAAQPRECAFDNPAAADDLEPAVLVGPLDDLQRDREPGDLRREFRPGVAAIGEYFTQPRKSPQRLFDQIGGAIAILGIGGDHLDGEEMAFGVDDRITLDTLGFLARVIADRIDTGPPFSVAFATWVSITPAVGAASRPHASRHFSSSAW